MRRIAFTAYRRMQMLDVTGPWEVFDHANHVCGRQEYELLLASPDGEPVTASGGLTLQVTSCWADVSGAHTIMIPGGIGVYDLIENGSSMNSMQRLIASADRVASVCTGAFVLAELGALDGRSAVTHWSASERLRTMYPSVMVQDDRLYQLDRVWSSAGVSAGMDMALAMIERDQGASVAHEISKWLVLFMRRTASAPQLGPALQAQAVQSRSIARTQAYIANHPSADLRIEALAERMHMSARSFSRAFSREVGLSPGRYVAQVRVEHAVRLLESTDRGVDDIAAVSGIGSRESLRRRMHDALGLTPSEVRNRRL